MDLLSVFSCFSRWIWSFPVLWCPLRQLECLYQWGPITIKCNYLFVLCPFPPQPHGLLNMVVEEQPQIVLEKWSPSSFGCTEQSMDTDNIVGGRVGWRSKIGHRIGRIDSSDGLMGSIEKSGGGMKVGYSILSGQIQRPLGGEST